MLRIIAGVRPNIDDVKEPRQRDLLLRCWDRAVSKRPKFASILQDPDLLMVEGCDAVKYNAYKGLVLNK
jgi:hypothetical protein